MLSNTDIDGENLGLHSEVLCLERRVLIPACELHSAEECGKLINQGWEGLDFGGRSQFNSFPICTSCCLISEWNTAVQDRDSVLTKTNSIQVMNRWI
jgi:hypothetical protein